MIFCRHGTFEAKRLLVGQDAKQDALRSKTPCWASCLIREQLITFTISIGQANLVG